MLERFEGESGRRLRVESFATQKMVQGRADLAELLADRCQLIGVKPGDQIIQQDAHDNEVYMILAGSFDVVVNGKTLARRFVNDHVGEMAAIEPSQARSASIIATEPGVVARLTEPDLAELANQFPEIYKLFARELARRLKQRNAHVTAARDKVHLFIISSVESLEVARIIQNALEHDPITPLVWTDGVFRVSNYALQSLEDAVDRSDFAIAVAHADDVTSYRGMNWPTPRDNVIFELGLFMGRLGKERAILMEPRDAGVKLPSDLAGVTTIAYRYEKGPDEAALMGPACNALRQHIRRLGPNN